MCAGRSAAKSDDLLRPHSERFCDVALTVKFYCGCDVAKSLRMGPRESGLPPTLLQVSWVDLSAHATSVGELPNAKTVLSIKITRTGIIL